MTFLIQLTVGLQGCDWTLHDCTTFLVPTDHKCAETLLKSQQATRMVLNLIKLLSNNAFAYTEQAKLDLINNTTPFICRPEPHTHLNLFQCLERFGKIKSCFHSPNKVQLVLLGVGTSVSRKCTIIFLGGGLGTHCMQLCYNNDKQ